MIHQNFFSRHFYLPFFLNLLELDKRAEMFEGSGDGFGDVGGGSLDENGVNLGFDGFGGISEDIVINGTPAFEMIEEVPVHPDLIETAVFCKNIRSVQVLTEAIRGFQGNVYVTV